MLPGRIVRAGKKEKCGGNIAQLPTPETDAQVSSVTIW
jgi:hypothetical protein